MSVLCRNPGEGWVCWGHMSGVGVGTVARWPGVHNWGLPTSSSNTGPGTAAVVTVSVLTHTPTCPHTASLTSSRCHSEQQHVSHCVTVLSWSRDAREGRRAVS